MELEAITANETTEPSVVPQDFVIGDPRTEIEKASAPKTPERTEPVKKRKRRGKFDDDLVNGEFIEWYGEGIYGAHPTDLSGRALTAIEKKWFGEQLFHGVMSAGELAMRFKLDAPTLSYYKQVVKNNHKQFRDDKPCVTIKEGTEDIPEPNWWTDEKPLAKMRLEDNDKLFIIQKIDSKQISVGDFSKKFGLPHSTVSGFRSQLKKKGHLIETEKPYVAPPEPTMSPNPVHHEALMVGASIEPNEHGEVLQHGELEQQHHSHEMSDQGQGSPGIEETEDVV